MGEPGPGLLARLLRWIAAFSIRGPDAPFILDDLDELFERDVARGVRPSRARVRYARNLLASAVSIWRARLRAGGGGRARPRKRRGGGMWSAISWLDVKLGLRMMVKYPGLTLVGGLGIAVAIAIGAFLFAAVAAVYSPLPFDAGERVVAIENWDTRRNDQERQILHDFVEWREQLESVEDLGAWRPITRNLIVDGAATAPVEVAAMTASGFRLARVPPLLGRYLSEEDEREGAPPVVVIGEEVWRTRFASDPGVVGRTVRLGSEVHTVVGVMPARFEFPLHHRLWVPLRANPADYRRLDGPEIFVFGRLAPGATLEGAQAELETLGRRAAAAFPETHERLRPRVVPYTLALFDEMTGWEAPIAFFLVLLLLAEICVNVAILVYARTATRRGEIAVRSALGASRGRIVGQLFAEALVLSAVAGAVGLALAGWALDRFVLVVEQSGSLPFWMEFRLSTGTVLYALGLAVLGAAIIGIVPALKATGRRVQVGLQRLASGSVGFRLGASWTALIVAQVGVAVAVLPTAVYYTRESIRYGTADPGYAVDEFLTTRSVLDWEVPPSADEEASAREFAARYAALQAELIRRLEAEPAVSAVIPLEGLPGFEPQVRIELESAPAGAAAAGAAGRDGHVVGSRRIHIDYFDVLGIPVTAGRRFHAGDVGAPVAVEVRDSDGDGWPEIQSGAPGAGTTAAIVNESFVRQVLGGASALGRRFRYAVKADEEPGPWFEIVGVVADFPAQPMEPDRTQARVYHPAPPGSVFERLAVRVRGADPASFASRLREIAVQVDPSLRLTSILTLDEVLREEQGALRLGAFAIALITLSVLLLSSAGIYALLSFTVARRRREIGIRAALGAGPRRLLASIFSRALAQLAVGILLGAALAPLLLGAAGPLNRDKAVVLAAVALFMLAVGLVAAVGPARRGLRIQPTEALRAE